ncbi:MAG: DUF448 domain-containing protein [Firmicutes bacterium]|nr:DUF448 domain-containing protein [Bacillota bacterium]
MTTIINNNVEKKHIPLRMCIVCRKLRPKQELLRMGRSEDGLLHHDQKRTLKGKGIYICLNNGCIKEFLTGKRFRRMHLNRLSGDLAAILQQISENQTGMKGEPQEREQDDKS